VEHLGSARTDAELALLLSAARDRLSLGQGELDLGDLPAVPPRLNDVADWTSKRQPPGGQTVLHDEPAAAPRRGRPAAVNAGGRVVATSSLVLWQVLTAAVIELFLPRLEGWSIEARGRSARTSRTTGRGGRATGGGQACGPWTGVPPWVPDR
jgi:hypothetical protein